MPILVQTYAAVTGTEVGRNRGRAYLTRSEFLEPKEMFPPFGVAATALRPSRAIYKNRVYMAGSYNQNVVIDEHRRFLRQGLQRPSHPPIISVGGGGTVQVPYQAFYDELTDEWGPLSAAGAAVTGDTNRSWSELQARTPEDDFVFDGTVTLVADSTSIPGELTRFSALRPGDKLALSGAPTRFATISTVASDVLLVTQETLLAGADQTINVRLQPRASHVGLFVSVDGAAPRLAEMRQLGVTTATESVASLALGMTLDEFDRIPRCTINVAWHDRQVMAGDEKHPDILYFSALNLPERFEGFSLPTRNGEPIVALVPLRDILLVLTPDTSYVVTGYTEDDVEMNISDGQLGGFNHAACRVIHGRAWVPNRKGVYIFDGAWHNVILDRVSEWQETYKAHKLAFESGFSVDDESNDEFKFCPTRPEGNPIAGTAQVWVGNYGSVIPEVGGNLGQAVWSNDSPLAATDNGSPFDGTVRSDWQEYVKDPTSGIGKLVYGTCDGRIMEEDDAFDPIQGWDLILSHQFFADPGGGIEDGKTLEAIWAYVESEFSSWTVHTYPGDEYALPIINEVEPAEATWKHTQGPAEIVERAPKTVWPFRPRYCRGRGFTFRFNGEGSRFKFRGMGGLYRRGVASRLPVSVPV